MLDKSLLLVIRIFPLEDKSLLPVIRICPTLMEKWSFFFPTKSRFFFPWKMCQNTCFWSNLEKMLKIFWFILKVVNIKFRNTCRIFMIWHFLKIFKKLELKLLENSKCTASYLGYYKIAGLQPTIFSGTPWNWGIHISGYWKIAGLRPAIFRGTLGIFRA